MDATAPQPRTARVAATTESTVTPSSLVPTSPTLTAPPLVLQTCRQRYSLKTTWLILTVPLNPYRSLCE